MATSPASLKVFSSRTTNLLTLAKHLLPFPTTTTIAAATIKPLLDHPPLHFPVRTRQDDLLFQVTQVIGGGGMEGKGAAIVEARGWVDEDDGSSDDDEDGAMSDINAVEGDESEDHEDEDDDDFDFDEDDVDVEENEKKDLK